MTPNAIPIWEHDDFVIKRAKYWWESAQQHENEFDKFISGWISFNIFYNYINKKYRTEINLDHRGIKAEINRIKSTVRFSFNESMWTVDLNQSIEKLIGFDAPIFYRKSFEDIWIPTDNLISEIREDIKQGNHDEALVKTYVILYKVRTNLFHGDKSDANKKDAEVVALCWNIMKNLYPQMLKNEEDKH